MNRAKGIDTHDIQKEYGMFFHNAREGIIISGREGWIIKANPAAARILGYKNPAELEGKKSIDLYDDPYIRKQIFDTLKKHGHIDQLPLTFKKKDGKLVHLIGSAMASKNKKGEIIKVQGIFTDITEIMEADKKIKDLHADLEKKVKQRTTQIQKRNRELKEEIKKRKQKERELRASEKKFKLLFQMAPDGIFVIDLDGRIINRNKAAFYLGGFSDKEVIGKRFHETPSFRSKQIEAYKKIFNLFLQGKIKPPLEFEYTTKKNETRIAEAHFSLIREKASILGILAIVRDITQKKQTELALRTSEIKLREQNQLLEEKNIALREVMTQVKEEKDRLIQQVRINLDKLVFPVIERLKLNSSKTEENPFLTLLEDNLKNIVSPFGQEITNEGATLTPKEIEICNMIATGMSSKEIGKILHVSHRTIETHRNNIRKKLGIQNERINLASYLKQMKLSPFHNA